MLRLVEGVAQSLLHLLCLVVFAGDVPDVGQTPEVAGLHILGYYYRLAEVPDPASDLEFILRIKAAAVAVVHISKSMCAECPAEILCGLAVNDKLGLFADVLVIGARHSKPHLGKQRVNALLFDYLVVYRVLGNVIGVHRDGVGQDSLPVLALRAERPFKPLLIAKLPQLLGSHLLNAEYSKRRLSVFVGGGHERLDSQPLRLTLRVAADLAFDHLFPCPETLSHVLHAEIEKYRVSVREAAPAVFHEAIQRVAVASYLVEVLREKPLIVPGGIEAARAKVDKVEDHIGDSKSVYQAVAQLLHEYGAVVCVDAPEHDELRIAPGKALFHSHQPQIYPAGTVRAHKAELAVHLVGL